MQPWKLVSALACAALIAAPLSLGAASAADESKAPWKQLSDRQSHEVAVDIGLVPSAASPQRCTQTLVLRQDKRIALTWVSNWGLKPDRDGACGDRQPVDKDNGNSTTGFLALKASDGTWSPIQDLAEPDCLSLERALVDAGLDIDAILAVTSQVVRLSPLTKCKLTIVDDQTPWRSASTKKTRAVATDIKAAPIKDFPDRCYELSLLRADSRVGILSKTRWGAKVEQVDTCGAWESFARPIVIWTGNRWKQLDDVYTTECSALSATLRSYGVPQSGIDRVLAQTLGGTTGSCT